MKFLLKWIGPNTDGKIWYVKHVAEPIFEATFSANPDEAFGFPSREAAHKVADHWKVLRGRPPKKPRKLPFEIVERS